MPASKSLVFLEALRLRTKIGVTEEEQASSQTILADLEITPDNAFDEVGDDLSLAVDYAAVHDRILKLAAKGKRKLLERLAREICTAILKDFSARKVTVTLRKKLLPECDYSGVRFTMKRKPTAPKS